MADVLKWGLIAGGAYLLYAALSKPTAPAAAAAGSAPAPAATPPASTPQTTTTLAQLLQTAAASDPNFHGTYNADQWSYYYQRLPGRVAIPAPLFDSIFFPSGRPADPSQYPQYTASDYAAAVGARGLSGPGARLPLPVPMVHVRRRR